MIVAASLVHSAFGEERRARELLETIAAAVSYRGEPRAEWRRELSEELARCLDPEVVLRIPELVELAPGRGPLVRRLVELAEQSSLVTLSFEQIEVRGEASDKLFVQVDATLTVERTGRRLVDARSAAISIADSPEGYRVTFVDVEPKPRNVPEARP